MLMLRYYAVFRPPSAAIMSHADMLICCRYVAAADIATCHAATWRYASAITLRC